MPSSDLVARFRALAPHLRLALEELEARVARSVSGAGVKVHSLTGRVKGVRSFVGKIARPDRFYERLAQVTDLLALRVIVYSEDVIEEVARLVEKEYEVDYDNSTNKLRALDVEKFGYRSLHYVCSLPEDLRNRYPDLGTLKFEIQIRTILQHTWAEIEHDIGYKSAEGLPAHLRRRFSQVASLLEIADREFAAIRTDLRAYEKSVREADPRAQERTPLDPYSLRSIIGRPEVRELDAFVASALDKAPSDELFYPDYLVRVLHAAGLRKVRDVLEAAQITRDQLSAFLPAYFRFTEKHWGFHSESFESVKQGYGLLFAAHLTLLKEESLLLNKVESMARFYGAVDYPDDVERAKAAGREIVASLKADGFLS